MSDPHTKHDERSSADDTSAKAILEREIPVEQGGWIAARVESSAKTHAAFGVFAHTSPVYYRVTNTPFRRAESAGAFLESDDLM